MANGQKPRYNPVCRVAIPWCHRVRFILDLEWVMGDQFTQTSRRQFFRGAGVAAGVGTLAGLGLDLKPVQAAAARLKIKGAREVPSICPYCAVGCAQIVSVRAGPDRQHRGAPGQPDQPRHALPQGLGRVPARGEPEPPDEGQVSRSARNRVGRERPRLGDGSDRASASRKRVTATSAIPGRERTGTASRSTSGSTTVPRSPRWAGRRWTTNGTMPI